MYLKELTLRGFKSFASATTLRFEPGITAVVGPNGSGKSNIVDALAWVMGEQGAKTLRGSSMEDVIFAGTSSRPPLGRAQVSLTIDNTDHALDIEYTEVTISRTIFRSGGSEYAINGSPARLLDIQELLSDTGLGSQMHVIVGQGRLSTILHADPAGHRAIIEEAAGILKHRKRKERSLRKLKATQDNLARLDDLLSEINRQMGPLGRQARISRRAEGIHVTLRDAKARLLADDASTLVSKRAENRAELGRVRGQLVGKQRDLARVKLRIEQLEEVASQASPAITTLTDAHHRLAQIDERYQSLAFAVGERRRSVQAQGESAHQGSDPSILEARATELETQLTQQSAEAQKLAVEQEEATQVRASAEAKLAATRQTIAELRKSTKEREGTVTRLEQLVARQEVMLESAAKRLTDYEDQKASAQSQLEAARAEVEELQRSANSLRSSESSEDTESLRERLDTAEEKLAQLRDSRQASANSKIRLDARADALRDTMEQRTSRKSIVSDPRISSMGSLAGFLDIEEGWEEAIAKALSDFAGAVVVEHDSDLDMALTISHEKQAEQTALLTASRGTSSGGQVSDDRLDVSTVVDSTDVNTPGDVHDGVGGVLPAACLVHAHQGNEAILTTVRSYLSSVGVCETWQEARAAISSGTWSTIVTKTGEVVTPVGIVTASGSAPSDLSLAARRAKAVKESVRLAEVLEGIDKDVEEALREVDELSERVTAQAEAQAERERAAQQAQAAVEMRNRQLQEYDHRLGQIDENIAQIHVEVKAAEAKKSDLAQALEQTSSQGAETFSLEEFEQRETANDAELNSAREAEMTAKLASAEASRKVDSLTRQVALLRDEAARALKQRAVAQERAQRRQEQLEALALLDTQIGQVRSLIAQYVADLAERREQAQKAASQHDEELTELRGRRNELEPVVTQLTQEEHELDVERERFATQFGQLTQKVNDELGMQVDALVRDFGPDISVPVLNDQGELEPQTVPYVRAEQEKRLAKAESDLTKLGKINPLATEEFEALQERHTYLNDQRNDVSQSRDDLLHLVHDLDDTMQRVFKEAFDDVAQAFQTIFAVLFPGGTGRLRLEDENDLLNTGVLVEASPAGKRVKQLTLLSGGEKSLTSLALLLAIFTARPSPFYVMDEVEAALDDINLTRLLQALKQLREHAQLIIITHQQRTMSIADALYGITMRSDGVTAVISQKLE